MELVVNPANAKATETTGYNIYNTLLSQLYPVGHRKDCDLVEQAFFSCAS